MVILDVTDFGGQTLPTCRGYYFLMNVFPNATNLFAGPLERLSSLASWLKLRIARRIIRSGRNMLVLPPECLQVHPGQFWHLLFPRSPSYSSSFFFRTRLEGKCQKHISRLIDLTLFPRDHLAYLHCAMQPQPAQLPFIHQVPLGKVVCVSRYF